MVWCIPFFVLVWCYMYQNNCFLAIESILSKSTPALVGPEYSGSTNKVVIYAQNNKNELFRILELLKSTFSLSRFFGINPCLIFIPSTRDSAGLPEHSRGLPEHYYVHAIHYYVHVIHYCVHVIHSYVHVIYSCVHAIQYYTHAKHFLGQEEHSLQQENASNSAKFTQKRTPSTRDQQATAINTFGDNTKGGVKNYILTLLNSKL